MKNEQRKSTSWLMGGLAALAFLSSGSLASAQEVTSYNDLAPDPGQLQTNITTFTSPNGGSGFLSSGQLRDFADGSPTAVTLTVTGGRFTGPANAAQGANPTTGDAFDIFDGRVDGQGVLSYVNPPAASNLVLTFMNMAPDKTYDLTYFADRGANAWDRASLVTISGQDAFVNMSSVATDNPNETGGVLFTGPTDTSTRLPADNPNGYVARFSNVKPGGDGQVELTISWDGTAGNENLGKYGSAIRLIEEDRTLNKLGDLDGDGQDDIVWRNANTGDVSGWLMNGLVLGTHGVIGTVSNDWEIVGVGDLDGDGRDDIVWRNANTGDVSGWLMNGLVLGGNGVIGTVSNDWEIVSVDDLDGNGTDDLIWRNLTTGAVSGWLMNGLVLGGNGVIGTVSNEWEIVSVDDLDGNGTADLIWRNLSTGAVSGWLMNGLVLSNSGVISTVSSDWIIRGTGDLDGNGTADLIWRHMTTGAVSGWLMNGLVLSNSGVIATVSNDWKIRGMGDLDGNGTADLIWRHMTTGAVSGWLMNGLVLSNNGVISGGVALDWKIKP